jgi:hypothetical protein
MVALDATTFFFNEELGVAGPTMEELTRLEDAVNLPQVTFGFPEFGVPSGTKNVSLLQVGSRPCRR